MTHRREAEGGEEADRGHTHEKKSSELHGESCAPDSKQTTAWAREQRKRTRLLAHGQAVPLLAMGCSQLMSAHGCCGTGKAITPCQTAQLVGARGVCFTGSPTCCLCCPNEHRVRPKFVPCLPGDSSTANPHHYPLHQLGAGVTAQSPVRSCMDRHPLSFTLIHTQNGHKARVPKNTSSAQQILNSKCLQQAAHGQSSSYHLIKKKN